MDLWNQETWRPAISRSSYYIHFPAKKLRGRLFCSQNQNGFGEKTAGVARGNHRGGIADPTPRALRIKEVFKVILLPGRRAGPFPRCLAPTDSLRTALGREGNLEAVTWEEDPGAWELLALLESSPWKWEACAERHRVHCRGSRDDRTHRVTLALCRWHHRCWGWTVKNVIVPGNLINKLVRYYACACVYVSCHVTSVSITQQLALCM